MRRSPTEHRHPEIAQFCLAELDRLEAEGVGARKRAEVLNAIETGGELPAESEAVLELLKALVTWRSEPSHRINAEAQRRRGAERSHHRNDCPRITQIDADFIASSQD